MWLALIGASGAQSLTPSPPPEPPLELEVGLGAFDLVKERGLGDPRLVVRALRGPVALELSGSMDPWVWTPDALDSTLYDILKDSTGDWYSIQRHGELRLLADVGVPTLTQRFGGSPHLYAGAQAMRYTMRSMGVWSGDINNAAAESAEWSAGLVVGAGLQAYVGPVSLRLSVLTAREPTNVGGAAFNSRGSWDLLYRF